MLRNETFVSLISVLVDGQLQIRYSRRIYDGAELLAETYHRNVLVPGDDVSREDPRVQAIARVVWTPAIVKAYQDRT